MTKSFTSNAFLNCLAWISNASTFVSTYISRFVLDTLVLPLPFSISFTFASRLAILSPFYRTSLFVIIFAIGCKYTPSLISLKGASLWMSLFTIIYKTVFFNTYHIVMYVTTCFTIHKIAKLILPTNTLFHLSEISIFNELRIFVVVVLNAWTCVELQEFCSA